MYQIFSALKYRVNILFQGDISAVFRIIYNTRARRLGAKLKSLENRAVLIGIVDLTVFGKLLCLSLIVLKGVFEIFIERLYGVMLRRGGLLVLRGKGYIYALAYLKLGKDLVL